MARRFKELPAVASLSMKSLTVNAFLEKIANVVLVSAGILTGFAVIIAAGVVYNAARIALQERAWELASQRVLGFTRDEVSRLLFAELAIELALGIPIGFVFSRQLIDLLARVHSGETFQVPPIIGASTPLRRVSVQPARPVRHYLRVPADSRNRRARASSRARSNRRGR